jgi:23S rRNA (uracil1939-C5)-methyltransferase
MSDRPARGAELELSVDSLAYGGEGVARLGEGGYVVFVAGAIPGDRVLAQVTKAKRSHAHARTLEVLEPGPDRIPAKAQHPGVPWQVLPYERQLDAKQEQVEEALRRIGRLEGFELEQIVPAVQQWRYRNKLEYSFGVGEAGELVCGFHAPAGWNRVIAIDDCLIASELSNRARDAALRWAIAQGLRPWERGVGRAHDRPGERGLPDERTGPAADGRARLRNLVVREGRGSGVLQVRMVSTEGELEGESFVGALREELGDGALAGVLWTRSRQLGETTSGGMSELLWGEPELPERLGELELRISPEAFFQTNTEMAEVLYGIVGSYAALHGWERVYDLYSGIGTIALTLSPRAGELWGVELSEDAVADARAAASRNDIRNARFIAGDARLVLRELPERAGRPDVVVVDPPRAGLSQKVVGRIAEASPRRIVYVSCNPTTLAPNAAQLVQAGWRLVKVRAVDMFPQTHHIECVALLERAEQAS